MSAYRKKLIEVALPLDAINQESAREKSIRHGHPSTLHLWWARRPLAACRAVLFGQLVDDPSAWPALFPTEKEQDRERQRIFRLIEELVKWENSNNSTVLDAARLEIARSFARGRLADGEGDARDRAVLAEEASAATVRAYLAEVVPPVHDPFAGGGSIPLEAQRLGLRAIATDLNPVAVLINKALIEIPPKFAGRAPVGPLPAGERQQAMSKHWPGATGLAEDVRRYGAWMREEAYRRIGHLYPEVDLPPEHGGGKATVIAWLWARTVESPNPAFRGVQVPLVSSFWLATKPGRQAWVEPVVEGRAWRFEIRTGEPQDPEAVEAGTKLGRGANFRCVVSGTPIEPEYIKAEGKAGRMGAKLMAVVAEGKQRRIYLPPSEEMEAVAASAQPGWRPEGAVPERLTGGTCYGYGLTEWGRLFTPRQLVALTTFADLVGEARLAATTAAQQAGWPDDGRGLDGGGTGAAAYGDAVATLLAIAVDRASNYHSTICTWHSGIKYETVTSTFARQALPMTWDYAEGNPFSTSTGCWESHVRSIEANVMRLPALGHGSLAEQADAATAQTDNRIVATDPPYFDNIGYADLSDYFYVWLRHSLRQSFPGLFSTLLVPKAAELVATPYRHGGKAEAELFFLHGMSRALIRISAGATDSEPITIFYAFRQSETEDAGTASTGWETFLEAVIASSLLIDGTWPMRTEYTGNLKKAVNALASSIVLVCRKRPTTAPTVTRGQFRRLLRAELPGALRAMEKGSVAPVDLAQASIGPGMAVFSRHAAVLEADDKPMTVRSALQLINEVVDELRGEEEGELDRETRFAVTWFETRGFESGPYGEAEVLGTARSVTVAGVKDAGIIESSAGKVRLLRREALPADWDPATDRRVTVWEATQHLIKRLDEQGEAAAGALLARLGDTAEAARVLAYRLYTVCERRGWAEEGRAYNGLVVAWPDLVRLAGEAPAPGARPQQGALFGGT